MFEKYEADVLCTEVPFVSFSPGGVIRLNAKMVNKYELNNYSFCFLYYDGDTDCVGIKPLKSYKKGSVRMTKRNCSGHTMTAKKFIMRMGLEVEGRYAKIKTKGEMIIVDLEGIKWVQ